MCRWLAYTGSPLLLERALYAPAHSLIDQSLHSELGAEATNGDGFGIGWYDEMPTPGVFRSIEPAWNDQNLRELAGHIHSGHFFAHIRAAIGSAVQQTNCHPFRHGRWVFVHNGAIAGFETLRRDLLLAVDPALFGGVTGSTDSETLFYLALTFGLEHDPVGALEQAVGFVEATAHAHGVADPVQMTVGVADGQRLWAVRYSSAHQSRTLYVSADAATVQALHPDDPRFARLTDEDRVVVSEPLSDLPGVWNEVPESTALVIQPGADEQEEFRPRSPARVAVA